MLKAKAHELIPHFYALGEDLTPETNKVNAKLLICQSAFTCNGVNEEVWNWVFTSWSDTDMGCRDRQIIWLPLRWLLLSSRSFTLVHLPWECCSLKSLAVKFLKSLFVWQPRQFISLLIVLSPLTPVCQLCAAIDEYVVSGSRQDQTFEYVGYSKIFANFYSMQLAINKDPKHAVKTKALRVEWAASTM